jgi:type III secretion system FlhB-like substrate exporter
MTKYTRQAIALAYGKHPVPIITAKGDDDLAQRMIEEAEKQRFCFRGSTAACTFEQVERRR